MTRSTFDVAITLRRILRNHEATWQPDRFGRVGVCTCGHWSAEQPHTDHVVAELERAGIYLTTKDTP